jgi:hypothetical protein
MADMPDNPLTTQHLADINAALEKIKVAKRQLTLAKAANLDVTQEEQDIAAAEKTLRSIKQVYFPGQA